jgi:hypothetical protein
MDAVFSRSPNGRRTTTDHLHLAADSARAEWGPIGPSGLAAFAPEVTPGSESITRPAAPGPSTR